MRRSGNFLRGETSCLKLGSDASVASCGARYRQYPATSAPLPPAKLSQQHRGQGADPRPFHDGFWWPAEELHDQDCLVHWHLLVPLKAVALCQHVLELPRCAVLISWL